MIRGIIVNILSEGIYDVLISEDYENFNLKNLMFLRLSFIKLGRKLRIK